MSLMFLRLSRWPNSTHACFVCGKSRVYFQKADQILHSIANSLPLLQHLLR